MRRDELREAVVRPAAAAGLVVERALDRTAARRGRGRAGRTAADVARVAGDLAAPHRPDLTESAYEAAGGLRGAVVRTAEEVYGELTGPEADLARRILLRLVAPGDGTLDTRRPVEHAELDLGDPDGARAVLDRLVRARLLTFDDGTVELAHEASSPPARCAAGSTPNATGCASTGHCPRPPVPGWPSAGERRALRGLAAVRRPRRLPAGPPERGSHAGRRASSWPRRSAGGARAVWLRRGLSAALALLVLVASGTAVVACGRATAQAERDDAVFSRITAEADRLRGTNTALTARLDVAAFGMRSTAELRTRLTTDVGRVLSTRLAGHEGIGSAVAFAPDGRTLAARRPRRHRTAVGHGGRGRAARRAAAHRRRTGERRGLLARRRPAGRGRARRRHPALGRARPRPAAPGRPAPGEPRRGIRRRCRLHPRRPHPRHTRATTAPSACGTWATRPGPSRWAHRSAPTPAASATSPSPPTAAPSPRPATPEPSALEAGRRRRGDPARRAPARTRGGRLVGGVLPGRRHPGHRRLRRDGAPVGRVRPGGPTPLGDPLTTHSAAVWAAAFSPDGRWPRPRRTTPWSCGTWPTRSTRSRSASR